MLGKLREVAVGRILDNKADTVAGTITWNLWHLERQHLHVLDVLAVIVEASDDKVYKMVHAWTIIPVLQTDNKRSVVGARTRSHTVATADGKTLQLGNLLQLCLNLLQYLAGLLQRGTFGYTYLCQEHALVLLWHKARGQILHEEDKEYGSHSQQAP